MHLSIIGAYAIVASSFFLSIMFPTISDYICSGLERNWAQTQSWPGRSS